MATAYVEVPLTQGKIALVDLDDWEYVSDYKWHAHTGRTRKTYYASTRSKGGILTKLHHLITGYALVDHIDGDGLNNRKNNLRRATDSENKQNRKMLSHNTSGYKGVSWHKQRSKWTARIKDADNNKYWSLGLHATKEEAAKAYDTKARELFGERGTYNFPREGERGVND